MSQTIGRREFLSTATGAVALSAVSYHRVLGANDRIQLGIIGSGGRGRSLMKSFLKNKEVAFTAVCDVYETNLEQGLKEAGNGAKSFADFRKLLDDKELAAVVVATPDHWHHDQLVAALKAGKDVYLEKPMSLSIAQGAQMVQAVRGTNRIVQIGMQRRSAPSVHAAKKLLDDGELGTVSLVRAHWYWNMPELKKDRPLKGKLDWDSFCGPAGKVALSREGYENVAFLNWRYFWPFSGGNMTDQGTHLMDVIQWFLNDGQPPRSAVCQGQVQRLQPSETPDVFSAVFEYPRFLATWTLAYTNSYKDGWQIVFQGNKATMELDNNGYRVYPDPGRGKAMLPPVKQEKAPVPTEPHVENFLSCLRSRKEPNAPVEVGHHAVTGPHLANFALRNHCRAVLGSEGKVTAG
ncbi:MAG TPA: Gfo/Idh/MocA family oxidoreductase [Gemmataceae bacterium]|nr:Gfo/Idh/MocA family oxidoreductase [Gemmataceae bacterium]